MSNACLSWGVSTISSFGVTFFPPITSAISKIAFACSGEVLKNSPVNGYVFGRADFCGSLGLGKDDINKDEVLEYALKVSQNCLDNDFEFVVGGGVSFDSAEFFKSLNNVRLTSFETRKIIFDKKIIDKDMKKAISLAVNFELLYLENKRKYYTMVAEEDLSRIEMLKKRVIL